MRTRTRNGFTLVEILIVLTIILLVTTIAAPAIYTALNGRQVTDAARVFTGALAGVRDAAIRANEPRGIRLIPDPVRTIPPPGDPLAGTIQLVYNRMVQIEPAGDYSEGKITIGPVPPFQAGVWPPLYPVPITASDTWPIPNPLGNAQVLMVEESVFQGGYVRPAANTIDIPNPPTNWYWNIRLGEKIKINGTGRAYTVIGPCVVNPNGAGTNKGNYDLFVNVGLPGTTSPLSRTIYDAAGNLVTTTNPEFLFLVNGDDDDNDGYADEGWDGYNNNFGDNTASAQARAATDELVEWETEKWSGAAGQMTLTDPLATPAQNPSFVWAVANVSSPAVDAPYTILRRPVVAQSTVETPLPGGVVIDATTWNTTAERSRLPIVAATLTCEILVNPNGQLVPTTIYSTPTSGVTSSFIHFWLTDVTDVYPRGAVWGVAANGAPNSPPSGAPYELPMPEEVLGPNGSGGLSVQKGLYPPAGAVSPTPVLKGERRLVTLFTRNGVIVTNTIEAIEPTSANVPGEGFNINSVDYPFLKAQLGQREAR